MRIRVFLEGKCIKKLRFKETPKNNQVYLLIKYYMKRGYSIKKARSYSKLRIAVLILKDDFKRS